MVQCHLVYTYWTLVTSVGYLIIVRVVAYNIDSFLLQLGAVLGSTIEDSIGIFSLLLLLGRELRYCQIITGWLLELPGCQRDRVIGTVRLDIGIDRLSLEHNV